MQLEFTEVPEPIREAVRRMNGFYVGTLSEEEIEMFQACVDAGLASRDFNHTGGLLGLAKVNYHA